MPIQWIDDAGEEREVGKKAAALGDAAGQGLNVPRGFVVTAPTFEEFVQENGLEQRIQRILDGTDASRLDQAQEAENRIRALLENQEVDEAVREEIEEAYEKINMSEEVRSAAEEAVDLVGGQRETEFVAVRGSPTGARIPGAHYTELNVNGKDAVVQAVKECWASLYSAEALSMEDHVGSIHSMAVIVQRMDEPDVSGTAYSTDPVGGDAGLVEAVWGLGTALSSGATTPDRYRVDDRGSVTDVDIATKEWKMVRDPTSGKSLKQRVGAEQREERTLDDGDVRTVMDTVQTAAGRDGPVAVAFGLGRNGVTVFDVAPATPVAATPREERDSVVTGQGVAPGDASGTVTTVYSDTDIDGIDTDAVIASVDAAERLIPLLPHAAGIVADQGGASSNLAALARRLDVPCIVAAGNATDRLASGETVTIDGATGTVAEGVQEGGHPQEPERMGEAGPSSQPLTATHVKVVNSVAPAADGAVIPDRIDARQAEQVAETYYPESVWARTSTRGDWGRGPDNLGVLASGDRVDTGEGVILDTYGAVMRAADFVDGGAGFLGVDVAALEEDGGRDALLNALQQVGEHGEDIETAVILDDTHIGYIEAAVESGIDTVAVPEDQVERARRAVAKAERTFMLERLRDLQ
ncbi:MAG: PEP/pyruvate-binding domain-containing protein [Candidatus Nanohaloarchaea archaeon]|nr:PEP/pyruvate-binding domain-containing protein [Candidatus Nanohaloarchaea archaeon]